MKTYLISEEMNKGLICKLLIWGPPGGHSALKGCMYSKMSGTYILGGMSSYADVGRHTDTDRHVDTKSFTLFKQLRLSLPNHILEYACYKMHWPEEVILATENFMLL